ncbi:alpha/beta hydrolase [Endozoicomonas sp. SM1973]|uniref:Alpha/beta hydrolase n=1 Tax=Spartinivicinus marinus TaxID=2994442 RepID=A0A853I6T4_9GAMM|nr:alpha/beta hydrolase [Spartinivicinus marinus]MCX4029268.1 alpha/beta hydrolase [Spartinivicinus marinus]NYZ65824.1 alpha/beta hydrolase [Spartinivicinus marinus]
MTPTVAPLMENTTDVKPKQPANSHWLPVTGCRLYIRYWQPNYPAKGIVHILHGLAEHSGRYQRLAEWLNQQHFIVIAHDQRGHGKTGQQTQLGHFSDHNGWDYLISDVLSVQAWATDMFGELPVTLIGHSMGSYLAQDFLLTHSRAIHAVILSGSNHDLALKFTASRWIAQLERWRLGANTPSRLIDQLVFGRFNRRISPHHTNHDWLSRDSQQVAAYVADPLCGFISTPQLWVDLFQALQRINQVSNLKSIRSDLPIYVLGGRDDPISAGKRLKYLASALRAAGIKQVAEAIYVGGRHEMFNEINYQQVYTDMTDWLNSTFNSTPCNSLHVA